MKSARICFLWHMHQPYYTDPVSGSAIMPWVRLHASKAYFDMAYLLEKFPTIHATFNFTPSLLLQLQELGSGAVQDLFLEHAQRPAASLNQEEQAFMIRHFFSINWATMIRPYHRYHELLVKRGLDIDGQDLERIVRQFTRQDLLDLQVWFNLAWFGYGAVQRYRRLGALRAKQRGFTEDEKQEVLALQRAAMQEIIPMYRRLAERGQIELTTTPFFHPIIPLVIDTDFARRARPDLLLPSRFRAPEDAAAQLKRAVEFHTATFGRPPVGLWPSEGSVCPELIPMLPPVGLRWLATDEGVLARSLEAAQQSWHRPSQLYRSYRTGPAGNEVAILFRDRELSDAFGFVFHKTTAEFATADALRRIRQVIEDSPREEVLIPIVLDGENPWEHYHEGGEGFLTQLYSSLAKGTLDQDGVVGVTTATVSEALEAVPPADSLPNLHSGSWINQDFKIWIGHQEDNRAWDLLSHTRSRLSELSPTLPPDRTTAAWSELYAAEGSDWFWWYGDDFETAYKEEFDRLFRTHLRNVWTIAGATAPESLTRSICEPQDLLRGDQVKEPLALLHITLDGSITDFFEWRGAGTINPNPPLGAMWKKQSLFSAIYFGWSLDQLFLRLDPDEAAVGRLHELRIQCHFQTPRDCFRLAISPATSDQVALARQADHDGWEELVSSRLLAWRRIVELAVPFKDLQVQAGEIVQLTVVVHNRGVEIARYPHHQPVTFKVPGPEFEATLWRV